MKTILEAATPDNPADSAQDTAQAPAVPKEREADAITPITPAEFCSAMAIDVPGSAQAVVTVGRSGQPNDHQWNTEPPDVLGLWMAERSAERKPAYGTFVSAYDRTKVSRFRGRAQDSVVACRTLVLDIEGSPEKYNKPGGVDSGYNGAREAARALSAFVRATGLTPSYIVETGSGGLHAYFVLTRPLPVKQWQPLAQGLVALCREHGFKVDAQCTTDAARITRAPGSRHQATGKKVQAHCWRKAGYTPEELAQLFNVDGAEFASKPPAGASAYTDANAAALGTTHSQYSYAKAAEQCGAMRRAAARNGRDTPYPVWILGIGTAKHSVEGETYAHEISSGHEGYDQTETDRKLASLTAGPATCETWTEVFGPGGPCETCEWRGEIKSPITLGRITETSAPGIATEDTPAPDADAPEWVQKLNRQFAQTRMGSDAILIDFSTPRVGMHGASYGLGYLSTTAFCALHRGRFAPIQKPGDKPPPLANAWLAHPQRRQYEGVVFAPGEVVPPNILNLWQGFAVTSAPGDVSLWLRLLDALVPESATHRYVLAWLAWKVQNPGGVPDTVLVVTGGKGTGKNSLLTPLLTAFGTHAMLVDDPELIAGRFTHHLMDKALGVLDEAVFVGDPRQSDRIKSRVTARHMLYEQKGFDPAPGINRCAYVMLTNHAHAWQATTDERRAVVVETGDSLRGDHAFWNEYHAWANGPGPAALLHYLQGVDVSSFNPRAIPRNDALQRQIEMTALRDPLVSWWHGVLDVGEVVWLESGMTRRIELRDDAETEVPREAMRQCYEQSPVGRAARVARWPAVARRVRAWTGGGDAQRRDGIDRVRVRYDVLPPLSVLRERFTEATGARFD